MSVFRNLIRATGRWYRRLSRHGLDDRTREIVDVLGSVPAFEHASTSTLHVMAEAVHRRTYRRGESLYYEGDPGLGLYVVEEGRIRLTTEPEPGRSRELRQVGATDMFGVLSVLGDFRRMETAETVTEARVLGFFRPDLKNVLKRTPKAGAEIALALGRYVAAQHVELIRLMAEHDGRETALHTYIEAAAAAEDR
jgi:CRP-like cAMP-binding protein